MTQLVGCAAQNGVTASGRVEDNVNTITVPMIPRVSTDPNAGFNDLRVANGPTLSSPGAQQTANQGSTAQPAMALQVLESVPVGDQVKAGQQLVRFDTGALEAALARATADQKVAERTVDVLAEKETDLADQQATLVDQEKKLHDARKELADKRSEAEQGLAKLPQAKTKLESVLKDLADKKAQTNDGIDKLQEALAKLPADDTLPGVAASRTKLNEQLAQARGGLAKLGEAEEQASSKLRELEINKGKATKGLGIIKGKQDEVNSGLDKIADGKTKLADASSQLSTAQTQAASAVEARGIALEQARHALEQATVTAPSDGVVVSSPQTGEVVVPGAKLVELRPAAQTTLVWVEDTTTICVGAEARISTDATPGTPGAKVLTIGTSSEPPPSSVAASGGHTTRAVPVTLTLDKPLPAGLPVSATINTCQK